MSQIIGYSIKEIVKTEKQFKLIFPKKYIDFLLLMGKRCPALIGLDYSIENLLEFRKGVETILYQNFGEQGLQFLKKDDIIFLSSQGCSYLYFQSNELDDPPIYIIRENMKILEHSLYSNTFSNWLSTLIK